MATPDPLLRTQKIADAFGVSVSTVKRWIDRLVDEGVLKAIRTVGKHRLIPLSEAKKLAKHQGLPIEALERMGGEARTTSLVEPAGEINDSTRDELTMALRSGDTRRGRAILLGAYEGRDAVSLADALIRPVMERIGHAWYSGSVDIFQEHQASQVIVSALAELNDRLASVTTADRLLALGATPEGDLYNIALSLGELALREAGWQVRNLGPNLPLRSLASAVLEYRPRLVFLSVSHLADSDRFAREYRAFYETAAATGAAVVLGGRALEQNLRERLVYESCGERMAHLAAFARSLMTVETRGASHPNGPHLALRDDRDIQPQISTTSLRHGSLQ